MASQESVDQLTQMITQMQQTVLTMQTNITQLQNQQSQLIQNFVLSQNGPQHLQPDKPNDPPVNPLSHINSPINSLSRINPPTNPLSHINPSAILSQNQPDPVKDELEKIESILLKTGKAATQPTETNQDQLVIKVIQALVKERSFGQPLATIQQLCAAEIQDTIHAGILDKGRPNVSSPRKFGNNPFPYPNSNSKEVNTIDTQFPQNPRRRNPRIFTPLNMNLSEALDQLLATKHLTLLQPTPPPAVLPKSHDPSQFCKFHQGPGHSTNRCLRLRHSIQDLIDAKKIAPPNPKPNVTTNPLPNHNLFSMASMIHLTKSQEGKEIKN